MYVIPILRPQSAILKSGELSKISVQVWSEQSCDCNGTHIKCSTNDQSYNIFLGTIAKAFTPA